MRVAGQTTRASGAALSVMAGLVPAIHAARSSNRVRLGLRGPSEAAAAYNDVDGRDKPGHDGEASVFGAEFTA